MKLVLIKLLDKVFHKDYIKPTKTDTSSKIKMNEATMFILKEWKKQQRQAHLMLGFNVMQKNQLVFSNTKNSFIQPAKTSDWLKSHTHCSLLFEAGATIKSVQDRLVHSDVKTTMDVYSHVTASTKEDAIKKFETYLS